MPTYYTKFNFQSIIYVYRCPQYEHNLDLVAWWFYRRLDKFLQAIFFFQDALFNRLRTAAREYTHINLVVKIHGAQSPLRLHARSMTKNPRNSSCMAWWKKSFITNIKLWVRNTQYKNNTAFLLKSMNYGLLIKIGPWNLFMSGQ